MQATSTSPDVEAVVSEIEIAAPRERVFQALTDATQLKCWFSDSSVKVRFSNSILPTFSPTRGLRIGTTT
jgi:uncharacterized protein YndB with AHSA1/START domain